MFSNNQFRHLYFVKTLTPVSEDRTSGNLTCGKTADGKCGYLVIRNDESGETERTDLIQLCNIKSATLTKAAKLKMPLIKATTTLDEDASDAPVAGQVYVLKLVVDNAFCDSPDSMYSKNVAVKAKAGETAESLYGRLAAELKKAIGKRDVAYGYFDVTSSAAGIVVTATAAGVTKGFTPGIRSAKPTLFHIECNSIIINGSEYCWGATEYGVSDEKVASGYKIAEMEYFYHGERGDIYRGMGYPNNIATKLSVVPTEDYDVIDIHYAYTDEGTSSYRSEKQLTLVVPAGLAAANSLAGAGIAALDVVDVAG